MASGGTRLFGGGAGSTASPVTTQNVMQQLNQLIPGLSPAIGGAMSNINNLISGTESPAVTRNMNAYFGAGTGLGSGSEYLNNRAIDLYGQRSNQRQQLGLQNLSSLLSGVTQPFSSVANLGVTQRGQDIEQLLGSRGLDIQSQSIANQNQVANDQLTLQALGLLLNANK